MLLLLLACSGAPADDTAGDTGTPELADPAEVLLDLAVETSTDLYTALHFTVGDAVLEAMQDGELLSGETYMPEDVDEEHWATDGDLRLEWQVSRRDEGDVHFWDWAVHMDIDALVLPSAAVTGTASWTPTFERYDYSYVHNTWTGSIAIDGAAAVDAAWSGTSTFSTLNEMEGTIDGESVTWENPDPDVP